MIALMVITDGRYPPTIEQCIESARQNLIGAVGCTIIDDSADPEYASYLDEVFSLSYRIVHHPERLGLGGAVRSAWTNALFASHIFHLEDDFIFNEPIKIDNMVSILDADPHLAQLSLKRQPVNSVEETAGGFMQTSLDLYEDRGDFVSHRHLFSYNPCLIPRSVTEQVLSQPLAMLERDVTDYLLSRGYHFGVLGTIADSPLVTHIGDTHSSGYKW